MTDFATNHTTHLDGRTRRGEVTRERLLAAAVELFGSQGFEATSMKELAAAAGVRAPAIYNHFESKESMLAEVTIWVLEDFHRAVVVKDNPADSPFDRLEHLVRRHVIYQLEHIQLARSNDLIMDVDSLQHLLPEGATKQIRQMMRAHLDLLTEIIDQVIQSRPSVTGFPTSRLCALAVLTMCDRVLSWYKPTGALSENEVATAYWTLVCGMLHLPDPRATPVS